MFNPDFYPTPEDVIYKMLEGHNIEGKVILEPSAGKGNIIDVLHLAGASDILSCESNKDLALIAASKSRLISEDFFTVESHHISHIDYIIMNPPFSNADKHILHAFDIAPAGCKIVALCNAETLKSAYSETRKQLRTLISEHGQAVELGNCFTESERKTGVSVSMINLIKPGQSYNTEFEGFFMDDDPKELEANALMPYNVVRDLVNRYVAAVQLFDKQLEIGVQMNSLIASFYGSSLAFTVTEKDKPRTRNDFKKAMQKAGWQYIFSKMNLNKHSTAGLREDINKFVETQTEIPFTMKNIYKMLEIVIGTTGQRMDKALLEVFERVTSRCDENKMGLEGWKTNSYYLLTEKFILPGLFEVGWSGQLASSYNSRNEVIDDMTKALCYLTGENYDNYETMYNFFCKKVSDDYGAERVKYEFNTWYDFGFFEVKGFKKGTGHFKFKSQDVWAKFNQRIAKLKGYPLPQHKKQAEKPAKPQTKEPEILFSIKL